MDFKESEKWDLEAKWNDLINSHNEGHLEQNCIEIIGLLKRYNKTCRGVHKPTCTGEFAECAKCVTKSIVRLCLHSPIHFATETTLACMDSDLALCTLTSGEELKSPRNYCLLSDLLRQVSIFSNYLEISDDLLIDVTMAHEWYKNTTFDLRYQSHRRALLQFYRMLFDWLCFAKLEQSVTSDLSSSIEEHVAYLARVDTQVFYRIVSAAKGRTKLQSHVFCSQWSNVEMIENMLLDSTVSFLWAVRPVSEHANITLHVLGIQKWSSGAKVDIATSVNDPDLTNIVNKCFLPLLRKTEQLTTLPGNDVLLAIPFKILEWLPLHILNGLLKNLLACVMREVPNLFARGLMQILVHKAVHFPGFELILTPMFDIIDSAVSNRQKGTLQMIVSAMYDCERLKSSKLQPLPIPLPESLRRISTTGPLSIRILGMRIVSTLYSDAAFIMHVFKKEVQNLPADIGSEYVEFMTVIICAAARMELNTKDVHECCKALWKKCALKPQCLVIAALSLELIKWADVNIPTEKKSTSIPIEIIWRDSSWGEIPFTKLLGQQVLSRVMTSSLASVALLGVIEHIFQLFNKSITRAELVILLEFICQCTVRSEIEVQKKACSVLVHAWQYIESVPNVILLWDVLAKTLTEQKVCTVSEKENYKTEGKQGKTTARLPLWESSDFWDSMTQRRDEKPRTKFAYSLRKTAWEILIRFFAKTSQSNGIDYILLELIILTVLSAMRNSTSDYTEQSASEVKNLVSCIRKEVPPLAKTIPTFSLHRTSISKFMHEFLLSSHNFGPLSLKVMSSSFGIFLCFLPVEEVYAQIEDASLALDGYLRGISKHMSPLDLIFSVASEDALLRSEFVSYLSKNMRLLPKELFCHDTKDTPNNTEKSGDQTENREKDLRSLILEKGRSINSSAIYHPVRIFLQLIAFATHFCDRQMDRDRQIGNRFIDSTLSLLKYPSIFISSIIHQLNKTVEILLLRFGKHASSSAREVARLFVRIFVGCFEPSRVTYDNDMLFTDYVLRRLANSRLNQVELKVFIRIVRFVFRCLPSEASFLLRDAQGALNSNEDYISIVRWFYNHVNRNSSSKKFSFPTEHAALSIINMTDSLWDSANDCDLISLLCYIIDTRDLLKEAAAKTLVEGFKINAQRNENIVVPYLSHSNSKIRELACASMSTLNPEIFNGDAQRIIHVLAHDECDSVSSTARSIGQKMHSQLNASDVPFLCDQLKNPGLCTAAGRTLGDLQARDIASSNVLSLMIQVLRSDVESPCLVDGALVALSAMQFEVSIGLNCGNITKLIDILLIDSILTSLDYFQKSLLCGTKLFGSMQEESAMKLVGILNEHPIWRMKIKNDFLGDDLVKHKGLAIMHHYGTGLRALDDTSIIMQSVEKLTNFVEQFSCIDYHNSASQIISMLCKKYATQKDFYETIFQKSYKALFNIKKSEHHNKRQAHSFIVASVIKGVGLQHPLLKIVFSDMEENLRSESVSAKIAVHELLTALVLTFGRLVEPFVLSTFELLIRSSSDVNFHHSNSTFRTLAAHMSSIGVSQMTPIIGKCLSAADWRVRLHLIDMIEYLLVQRSTNVEKAISSLAPFLIELLCETHEKVSQGALSALRRVGSLANEEIRSQIDVLLAPLKTPSKGLDDALDIIFSINFQKVLGSASLALLVPVLLKGLRASNSTTKMKSARISSVLLHLVQGVHSIEPYKSALHDALWKVACDPDFETRITGSRALIALAMSTGELDQILSSYLQKLSDSAVDFQTRAACARTLACGISEAALTDNSFLSRIDSGLKSVHPAIREGFVLFLGQSFASLEEKSSKISPHFVPRILQCVTDEDRQVRLAAVEAATTIVKSLSYEKSSQTLGILSAGLWSPLEEVRSVCVQLIYTILMSFSTKGVAAPLLASDSSDKVDKFPTAACEIKELQEMSASAFGESYKSLLAALFVLRSSECLGTRTRSNVLWKLFSDGLSDYLKFGETVGEYLLMLSISGEDINHATMERAVSHLKDLESKLLDKVYFLFEKSSLTNPKIDSIGNIIIGMACILRYSNWQSQNGIPESLVHISLKYIDKPELRSPMKLLWEAACSSNGALFLAKSAKQVLCFTSTHIDTCVLLINFLAEDRPRMVWGALIRAFAYIVESEENLAKCDVKVLHAAYLARTMEDSEEILNEFVDLTFRVLLSEKSGVLPFTDLLEKICVDIGPESLDVVSPIITRSHSRQKEIAAQINLITAFTCALKSDWPWKSFITSNIHRVVPHYDSENNGVLKSTKKFLWTILRVIQRCADADDSKAVGNGARAIADFFPALDGCIQSMRQAALLHSNSIPGLELEEGLYPILTFYLSAIIQPTISENVNVATDNLCSLLELLKDGVLDKYNAHIAGRILRFGLQSSDFLSIKSFIKIFTFLATRVHFNTFRPTILSVLGAFSSKVLRNRDKPLRMAYLEYVYALCNYQFKGSDISSYIRLILQGGQLDGTCSLTTVRAISMMLRTDCSKVSANVLSQIVENTSALHFSQNSFADDCSIAILRGILMAYMEKNNDTLNLIELQYDSHPVCLQLAVLDGYLSITESTEVNLYDRALRHSLDVLNSTCSAPLDEALAIRVAGKVLRLKQHDKESERQTLRKAVTSYVKRTTRSDVLHECISSAISSLRVRNEPNDMKDIQRTSEEKMWTEKSGAHFPRSALEVIMEDMS